MATDIGLLEQLIQGKQPPTLRFYRWSPVAISLGYHQKQWPDYWRSLTWQGQPVEIVRRPTGGRAVLHQGDLTYAVVMPMSGQRRQDWYQTLCDALIEAWAQLGVTLQYGTAGRGYRDKTNCFDLATAADLVTPTGYKLVGSAQLRRDRYLLQHGSIRLWPDPQLYAQVFGQESSLLEPPKAIPKRGNQSWLDKLSSLIVQELERSLNISVQTASFSTENMAEIKSQEASFQIT
ncbi:biotin/lipoate A/B protein ligase family protein [Oscillatoria sp. CS-180]|nr:biotin/lipoate A/B protein ligase family protein [Oscillatoria sp. CS-180]MDB9529229.1 biotin/lipoate A/B protein ligase family protein [Oscillatoria sp. CS-180]